MPVAFLLEQRVALFEPTLQSAIIKMLALLTCSEFPEKDLPKFVCLAAKVSSFPSNLTPLMIMPGLVFPVQLSEQLGSCPKCGFKPILKGNKLLGECQLLGKRFDCVCGGKYVPQLN
jgi:hypothetical protein